MAHVTLKELVGTVLGVWLLSIIACIVSLRWALFSEPRRFWPGVVLCVVAFVVGCLGMTHYRVVASARTFPGNRLWKFDSKWYFLVTLVLAALVLAFTVWRNRKPRPPATST